MSRHSFRTLEEALAVEARLRKRETLRQAEAQNTAQSTKVPGKKGRKPSAQTTGAGEIRIIGGQWRRTRIAVAQRPGLRPTPDRVRETLFNWLGQDLTGWHCLDAFAGTGALGLEAASRGAQQVRLVEQDPTLVEQLVRIGNNLGHRLLKLCVVMAFQPCAPMRMNMAVGIWCYWTHHLMPRHCLCPHCKQQPWPLMFRAISIWKRPPPGMRHCWNHWGWYAIVI